MARLKARYLKLILPELVAIFAETFSVAACSSPVKWYTFPPMVPGSPWQSTSKVIYLFSVGWPLPTVSRWDWGTTDNQFIVWLSYGKYKPLLPMVRIRKSVSGPSFKQNRNDVSGYECLTNVDIINCIVKSLAYLLNKTKRSRHSNIILDRTRSWYSSIWLCLMRIVVCDWAVMNTYSRVLKRITRIQ